MWYRSNFVFQRPGPASKKAGFGQNKQPYKKVKAAEINKCVEQEVVIIPEDINANENQDKENGLLDSQPTKTTSFTSPRRVSVDQQDPSVSSQTTVVPETQENHAEETKNSSVQVVNLSDDEPVVTDSSTPNRVLAKDQDANSDKLPIDTDNTENAQEVTFEVSMCSVEESASDSSSGKIAVDQLSNSTVKDSTVEIASEITEPSPNAAVQSAEVVNIEEECSSTTEQQ